MKPSQLLANFLVRYLPALLVGLGSFPVLNFEILKAQYQLRGPLEPRSGLAVFQGDAKKAKEILSALEERGPDLPCYTLDPALKDFGKCIFVDISNRFDEKAFEELRKILSKDSSPDSHTKPILFLGNLNVFHPMASESVLLEKYQFLSKVDTLVFIPEKKPSSFTIKTAAGSLTPTEMALNQIDNIREDLSLKKADRLLQGLVSAVTVALLLAILYSYPILLAVIFILVIALLNFVIAMLLFDNQGFQMPMAAPWISSSLAYVLTLTHRLDRNDRMRWLLRNEADTFRQREEARTNFLSLVSHDLKTPMARMQSIMERFLRGDFGALSPVQKDQIERVIAANSNLQKTVYSLLLLSRAESMDVPIQREPSDLKQILEDLVGHMQSLSADRKVPIETELEPVFLANFDPALIREVAANLIENAIKYSPTGSKIVVRCGEMENCPDLIPPQPGLWFEVQDFGPGIPKEERQHVMSKFAKGKNEHQAADQSVKGSGLGLYLSAFFVEKHGGNLILVSRTQGEILQLDDPARQYFSDTDADSQGTVARVSLPLG